MPVGVARRLSGVKIRPVIWILLVLLTVAGGVAAVTAVARDRKKELPGRGWQRALPSSGDTLLERTVRELRVDDVIQMDTKDFLVEGLLGYDEDGHRWQSARITDGGVVSWLVIGMDRAAASSARLLQQDADSQIAGYPPEALVIGEVRYTMDKRGTATVSLYGDVGGLGALKKDRPEGHVERCRWWLYNAPGDDTVVVEQWGPDYRVLRGKRVLESTIELMQGS